ncbi:hypothetical protein HZA87_06115 [Candidatus Uhrbacteria bacterium]|nr:hypothetical protein [Candidatus Uhrbacteria bacterium]
MKVLVLCLEAALLLLLGFIALNGGASYVHNEAKTIYLLIVSHPILFGLLLLIFIGIADGFDEEEEKKRMAADAYLSPFLNQLRIEEKNLVDRLNQDVRGAVDPSIDVQFNITSTDN